MAHQVPTVTQFKVRFPELSTIAEQQIQQAIDDAKRFVGTNWTEADYTTGIALLAAHFLQTGSGSVDSDGIRSFSMGPLSVSYADNKSVGDLDQTSYGQRFLTLRDLNCRGAVVV